MSRDYSQIPKGATVKPRPFELRIPESEVADLQALLKVSKVGPPTWENQQTDRRFGVTHEWMTKTKQHWLSRFNWRAWEDQINSFPNFKMGIDDDSGKFDIHFVGLFSKKPDAIPLVLLHGWPGSFLEFLPMLKLWRDKYTPEELPYHVIVPSLPGYTLSSGPPLDRDFELSDVGRIINRLMVNLGFGNGYIAQGGDIGSMICQVLGATYKECRAIHVNMLLTQPPPDFDFSTLTPSELQGVGKFQTYRTSGSAYAFEHGTRPSTIGFVLSSNPLALLAWIGEKFLEWSDDDPALDDILAGVTLYWFTNSFPRSIYPYRGLARTIATGELFFKASTEKPLGYSSFQEPVIVSPRSWAEKTYNLVWYREQSKGGHFAALEQPQLLQKDIEEFVQQVW